MYKRALAAYEKALGRNHISTLTTANNLGLLYLKQANLDRATEMFEWVLVGKEKLPEAEATSLLYTLSNVGSLYEDQGKLGEAEKMYELALEGYKAPGPERFVTFSNLGNLYRSQGKLREPEEMFTQALVGQENIFGVDHLSTLEAVNGLGILYACQDKLGEAEACLSGH